MDLAEAMIIKSWIDAAKVQSANSGERVYLKRKRGGFEIVTDRPTKPTAEIWPGGRVVLWEQ